MVKVHRRLELKRLVQKLKDHADREKVKSISVHLLDLGKQNKKDALAPLRLLEGLSDIALGGLDLE